MDSDGTHPLKFDPMPRRKVQRKIEYYFSPYTVQVQGEQKMSFEELKQDQKGWDKIQNFMFKNDTRTFKRFNRMLKKVPEL